MTQKCSVEIVNSSFEFKITGQNSTEKNYLFNSVFAFLISWVKDNSVILNSFLK